MYEGIKKAIGPAQNKPAPLKSTTGETITDMSEQMHRWVEHYSELYATTSSVSDSALNTINQLPTMNELDEVSNLLDIIKAIDSMAAGKVPGCDGIPPDLLKQCKTTLSQPLHELLCKYWQEGAVPQDLRDTKIITLYKNKDDRSDCNNYRGISLLSIVGIVFARVRLPRLQKLDDRV
uniref:Reverse transcriptase domain-containing protein n=1 Tax=Biomphalaria glabrata TaxID=6526 RepID=A0A2C9KHL5_BIOGL